MSTLSSPTTIVESIIENAGVLVTSCLNAMAQVPLGQTFLRLLDRCLWIIERTAQWSLPYHETVPEENGKSSKRTELIRPLPWIFFLPGLVILRLFRATWNIGALILDYPQIQPSDIMEFVQKTRRRLRSIKTNAMKAMRQRKPHSGGHSPGENMKLYVGRRSLMDSIQKTLASLSCLDTSKQSHSPPMTRIKVFANNEMTSTPEEKSSIDLTIDSKRKHVRLSSDDESTEDSDRETPKLRIELRALEKNVDEGEDFADDHSMESSPLDSDQEEDGEISLNKIDEMKRDKFLNHNKNRSSNKSGKINLNSELKYALEIDMKKRTFNDEEENNEDIVKSNHQFNCYSPYQSNEDTETGFYSPISSKGASPERVISFVEDDKDQIETKNKLKVQGNGEKCEDMNSVVEDLEVSGKSNGHNKIHEQQNSLTPTKSIQKGKRGNHGNHGNHGNRKKK